VRSIKWSSKEGIVANQVKRALVVGINHYPDPRNNLRGCVNDALMMGKLLTENFAFNPEDVRMLVDERATTEAIRERLRWLVDGATPGSVLVFHYSGHGSQVRDRNGDELDDGMDEIICPYDLDWDDPFTDDEIAAVIKEVPEGVNFTLILDSCHSGTGSRMFFKEPPSGGHAQALRYLVPPPDVAFRMASGVDIDPSTSERTVNMTGRRGDLRVRRFGSAVVEQNALLIAGCRSDQTSADAWIDNDYHGALTYSLYWAIREHRFSLTNRDLVREAGGWLETQRYSQVPQIEGPEGMMRWSFLGTSQLGTGEPTTSLVPAPKLDTLASTVPETQIVFVHGIGDHKPGYSDRWRAAFNRYLGLPLTNFHEVVWDDVFDATRGLDRDLQPPMLSAAQRREADEIKEDLRDLLASRADAMMSSRPESNGAARDPNSPRDLVAERGIFDWLTNFDEYIGDFVKYLTSDRVRDAVDSRLQRALVPLLASGQPVVLITHSWGTVVAHHTLRRLRAGRPTALHVTLGSPLWIRLVRRRLNFDGHRFACSRWINIDADGDLIGGRLSPPFEVHNDLKVACVGADAHGSYFDPDNALVQRDIVARAIREIGRDLQVEALSSAALSELLQPTRIGGRVLLPAIEPRYSNSRIASTVRGKAARRTENGVSRKANGRHRKVGAK
jgi:hypothetical protein